MIDSSAERTEHFRKPESEERSPRFLHQNQLHLLRILMRFRRRKKRNERCETMRGTGGVSDADLWLEDTAMHVCTVTNRQGCGMVEW